MKLVAIGPDEIFYRFLTPKWSHLPTSGAGAAEGGGRFNKPGIEALYLARNPQTALDEYQQGATIAGPATLAAYHVSTSNVVDLSGGYDPAVFDPAWKHWDCDWKYIARVEKRIPPSWLLADGVISAGHAGILFPSTRHIGGVNLVLYAANFASAADAPQVHDPAGALPKNQSSWS